RHLTDMADTGDAPMPAWTSDELAKLLVSCLVVGTCLCGGCDRAAHPHAACWWRTLCGPDPSGARFPDGPRFGGSGWGTVAAGPGDRSGEMSSQGRLYVAAIIAVLAAVLAIISALLHLWLSATAMAVLGIWQAVTFMRLWDDRG